MNVQLNNAEFDLLKDVKSKYLSAKDDTERDSCWKPLSKKLRLLFQRSIALPAGDIRTFQAIATQARIEVQTPNF